MKVGKSIAGILWLFFVVVEANGAGVTFDYFFTPLFGSPTRVAHGTFTFNDSLLGRTIHYPDLDSFQITFYAPAGSSTYDLTYINTGSFSEYFYFSFNTSANSFVGTSINGFTTYLAAIRPGYVDGFWLGISHSGNQLTITDYSQGTAGFKISSSSVKTVPSLSIGPSGTNLVVSWPDFPSTTGFVLQQNSEPWSTNWSNVGTTPTVTNGRKQVIVPPDASQGYFRLKLP